MKWLLVAVMLLAVLLIGSSCETSVQEPGVSDSIHLSSSVSRFVDLDAGVVCWIYEGNERGGISCLPIDQTRLREQP